MDYSDTISFFRGLPLFGTMDPASIRLLAFASTHLCFDPGDVLCWENDPPDGVYVIEAGEVAISVRRGEVDVKVATVGRNEVVGEIAVILNQPRSATVKAATEVRVFRVDPEVFLQCLTGHPESALGVMRILCERITGMLKRLGIPPTAAPDPRAMDNVRTER